MTTRPIIPSLQAGRSYPRTVKARGKDLELRTLTEAECGDIVEFARGLQEEDLLFLPLDITRQDVVAEWVRNIEAGQTFTVLAYDGQTLAGYGSLNRQPTQWSRHLGEIRLNVGPGYRGTGLGSLLADEILDVARHSRLRKIIAQMPRDQEAARGVFRKLGFDLESMLADWVIDTAGDTHDLVIMAHEVGD